MIRILVTTWLALSAAGCAHPECWVNDEAHGCGKYSDPVSSDGDGPSEAERRAGYRRAVVRYTDGCAAGDPAACEMLGNAKVALDAPPAEIEAAFVVACGAGIGRPTTAGGSVCWSAARRAEDRGPAGRDAAIERYQKGCELGDSQACLDAGRLDPARAFDNSVIACDRWFVPGCQALIKAYADPTSRHHDAERARTLRRVLCTKTSDIAVCSEVGEEEAARW